MIDDTGNGTGRRCNISKRPGSIGGTVEGKHYSGPYFLSREGTSISDVLGTGHGESVD